MTSPAAKKKACAAHRAAQNKYVAKNPAAQRARVAASYQKNASSVKQSKASARQAAPGSHANPVAAHRAAGGKQAQTKHGTGAGAKGRPRHC